MKIESALTAGPETQLLRNFRLILIITVSKKASPKRAGLLEKKKWNDLLVKDLAAAKVNVLNAENNEGIDCHNRSKFHLVAYCS